MKPNGIVRNIDELGRLVIPKELRQILNMPSGSAVEIFSEDNKIILQKYYPGCHFCGTANDIFEFHGKYICEQCKKELASK